MSKDILDVADCSVVFLSYDEPKKEEFWLKVKNMVPWAVRVDGVKGSDAAHKAAAAASETFRFFLIDGDTLPQESFFNIQLDFTDKDPNFKLAQYRWKSTNVINGLRYGNGGISSWTKSYVQQMKTHEASDGNDNNTVDFCLDSGNNLYWAMWDCFSTTYPNSTPFQAWRAGFREGVKMCLNRGQVPDVATFKESVASRNLNNLTIWHNVGADVENGQYAMYGAQYGTYMTLLTDWNPQDVQWFDNYPALWEDFQTKYNDEFLFQMSESLKDKLGLPMCMLGAEQSKFFKRHYASDKYNMGPLVKEMDVIRKIEGW